MTTSFSVGMSFEFYSIPYALFFCGDSHLVASVAIHSFRRVRDDL